VLARLDNKQSLDAVLEARMRPPTEGSPKSLPTGVVMQIRALDQG